MTSEVDSWPKVLDVTHMVIIIFSWLLEFLHMNQLFFHQKHDPKLILETNPIVGFVANYLCLVLLGTLVEFSSPRLWLNSPYKIYFIIRWNFLTWPIIHALTLTIIGNFLLGSLKLSQNNELSLNQNCNSCLLEGKLPQLWDVFIWLAPGYGHLDLKAPQCSFNRF